jgi:hypothetical protein
VRCDDDVGVAEQRVLGDRLFAEDVECRAGHLAGVESVLEGFVDDQRTAGDVEDPHAVLHRRERVGVQEVLGVGVLRQVDGDEVSDLVDGLGADGSLDPELAEALLGHVGIERHHAHAEPAGPVRDELADATEADDAEHFVVQFHAGELRAVPAPGHQRSMRLRHVAGQREQQGHRVLGGGDDIGLRGVGDDDSLAGGRVDVDVVDPHAGPGDDLQPLGLGQQVGVELGGGADQDRVVVADPLGQLVLGPVVAEVDVEPGGVEEGDAGVADVLLDQDLHDRSA